MIRLTLPHDYRRRCDLAEEFDLSELVDEYRDEARQQLELLDTALLTIEQSGTLPEAETRELLRALHTLKGNSGMLGFAAVRDYVHAVESRFKPPPTRWGQPELDRLFEGAAALRRAVERAGTDGQDEAFARLPDLTSEAADAEEEPPGTAPARDDRATAVAGEALTRTGSAGELLRVPFAKLDTLLNQVGELVQAERMLEDLANRHRATLEAAGAWRAFGEGIDAIDRVADSLRTSVMDLRLVPIRRVFSRFPSLARDLAREQDKRVRVVLEDEDTELDKSTVDALGDPLLHLVRNAVDHGIEPPEVRETRGKPPEGRITLRAAQSGDQVRIEIEDDGAGLDRATILARAREAGLVGKDREFDPDEAGELIFRPGFSTRREASTVSGRGIGLDIVERTVAGLRGSIEVEDAPGNGTRFVLRLPLTLAIVPAVLFESGGERLALPATDVEETLRDAPVEHMGAARVVRHREELVPLARPTHLFGWNGTARAGAGAGEVGRFVLIVRRGVRAAAITADHLLDQQEVVVKAIPPYLGQPRAVSGATVTADGRVVLLLDAAQLIDLNLESHRRDARAGHPV